MSSAEIPISPRSTASIPSATKVKHAVKNVTVRPGWLGEDDDDEDDEDIHKRDTKGQNKHEEGELHKEPWLTTSASEREAFLPKTPTQSKSPMKETRHWLPSTSRHVVITPEMLNQQLDLDSPYNPNPFKTQDPEKGEDVPETNDLADTDGVIRGSKRLTRMAKFQKQILNRGYIPLALRFISLFFAIVALFLCSWITKFSVRGGIQMRPSTVMAFAVNAISLVYLPWIARDEYFGKAVGIRSPRAKLLLVLCDLFFIILNSADLALAFNVLYDSEAGCLTDTNTYDTPDGVVVCKLQQSLATVLFITLVGFVINFTVSLYRLVERIFATES